MKKLIPVFFLFSFSLIFAQDHFDYAAHWQKIEQLEQEKGQFKSLLPKIETIYKQAKKEENTPQRIKAFIYRAKIIISTADSENIQRDVVRDFEAEIKSIKAPGQAIMQSMLAEIYQWYYQQNSRKIADRTTTAQKLSSDFRYWSAPQFRDQITALYQESLSSAKQLRQTPIHDWAYLLKREEETTFLRPTLYDFIAHRALTYFSTRYGRKINPENGQEKAKDLLAQLITFHQEQNDTAAVAYNKLKLLELKQKELEKSAFEKKLLNLAKTYPDNAYTPFIYLKIANFYRHRFEEGNPEKKSLRKKWAEAALHYSELISQEFPGSKPATAARAIQNKIKLPYFQIQIGEYISPDRPTPMSITYRNLNHLYFRVFSYRESAADLIRKLRYADHKQEKQQILQQIFHQLTAVKKFDLQLNLFRDYQNRTTLGKLPKLSAGHYLIFTSNEAHFNLESDSAKLSYVQLKVSPYALAFRHNNLLLTNRETGAFIPHKKINVFSVRNGHRTKMNPLKTDAFGIAHFQPGATRQLQYQVEGDAVYFVNYSYRRRNTSEEETTRHTQFFTDRKIYRPGQPLYFKAVAYTQSPKGKRRVSAEKFLTIKLINPNGKVVRSQRMKTNAFGSVSGKYILPTSGLTGEYYLASSFSTKPTYYRTRYSFRVEEYKRPKFEVIFEEPDSTYQLEKKVAIHGEAKSYTGAPLNSAQVSYRVYRQAVYPYWPWWRRPYFPLHPQKEEITHGKSTTQASGRFTIEFIAKPETEPRQNSWAEEDQSQHPRTYRYTVEVAVTDLNGETHTAHQTLVIGDLRYTLSLPVPEKIAIAELDSFPIQTQNLNGKFVPATGKISLTKIVAPKRVLRDSPFPQTDYELYDKATFIRYFPHEAYANENLKKNWKKGKTVFRQTFDTQKSKSVAVEPEKWASGYYRLKAFMVDHQDTISQERLVYLYRKDENKPVDNELFSIHLTQDKYRPGDLVEVQVASAAQQAEVLLQVEINGDIVDSQRLKIGQKTKKFTFPIEANYRGKIFVHYYFGKFNTAQSGTLVAEVPRENPRLKLSLQSFRSKLKPGAQETWTLSISGSEKDRILAELLATMYDASLDQFSANNIHFTLSAPQIHHRIDDWDFRRNFGTRNFRQLVYRYFSFGSFKAPLQFDRLNWFGFYRSFSYPQSYYRTYRSKGRIPSPPLYAPIMLESVREDKIQQKNAASDLRENAAAKTDESREQPQETAQKIVPRRALQETAFFYPHLLTDKEGNVKIQFTVPESLTTWKFMVTAHTKDMRTGYLQKEIITQKELMVRPNPPRFLRMGDTIRFSSKISNLSNHHLEGEAQLLLFDAFTMQPIDSLFGNTDNLRSFRIDKTGSTEVSWQIQIPETHQAVVYRVIASAGNFSDGVENALPVLSNRKLVTETLPIFVREGQEKTFTLDKLQDNTSKSLKNFKLTFEMTQNPIWYAIFSLPYLRAPNYHNSIADFGWLYGNLISQKLINSNPKIKAVFKDWQQKGQLTSKLAQNQELKALLLAETPWVREAESEQVQMKRIALLFDLTRMQNELKTAFRKLAEKQSPQGGFPWFPGGDDNRYVTTYIVSGLGHLKAMGIDLAQNLDGELHQVLTKAINYLDQEAVKEYVLKHDNEHYKINTYGALQYLYARSMFLHSFPLPQKAKQLRDDILTELETRKFDLPLSSKALAALIFERYGKHHNAVELLQSVKDHAVVSEQMGMYWKANRAGWIWAAAPIETQALLIEAFDRILSDPQSVESMKVWLLRNRQTHQWASVRATTEAVYALMSTGKDWINTQGGVSVEIGGKPLNFDRADQAIQTGTGYVKTSWSASAIEPEMGTVKLKKTSPGISWGALYWQYFEDLDKITPANTGLQIHKELFLKKNTAEGPVLKRIRPGSPIRVGDLITVRLKIQSDRNLQFVHLKDMRASGFEPVNVISRYQYQGGLGYYESTRDAATNFFIAYMPKGTYVFEYDLRANNAGSFSNGITILQNMYAPELSAHSKGIRVEIR